MFEELWGLSMNTWVNFYFNNLFVPISFLMSPAHVLLGAESPVWGGGQSEEAAAEGGDAGEAQQTAARSGEKSQEVSPAS